jgi:hypothetical protein
VTAPKGVVQINKIAAAQRQLDSAIRMFFQREDELAIHTVAAAAFGVLRDILKKRGRHFTKDLFRAGMVNIAKQYVAGTIPSDKKAMFEGTRVMAIIERLAEEIRAHGDAFDGSSVNVTVTESHEHKLWLSRVTVFLKHADRDAEDLLSADVLDNEKILMATCAAYIEVMKQPTPEIMAYFAFWSAKNDQVDDLAEEVQQFARKLQATNESARYGLCAKYIRQNKSSPVG